MKDIYLLSGLGCDERVYDFIDFSGFRTHPIRWIEPQENEPIARYAQRLAEQVHTPQPVLIGVSFGGMMAVELAKWIDTERVILISSAKTKWEVPFYYRMAGWLRLNRLVPARLLKMVNRVTFLFFGTETRAEENLLRSIIRDTDEKFLAWAVDQIVHWKNTTVFHHLVHIHGTRDKILPLKSADYKVPGGGHFMIVNKARQVSALIREVLK